MAKLGIDWFRYLTKEEQIQFCKNRVNHSRGWYKEEVSKLTIAGYLLRSHKAFSMFIDHAFRWHTTPEGQDYWAKISNRVNEV